MSVGLWVYQRNPSRFTASVERLLHGSLFHKKKKKNHAYLGKKRSNDKTSQKAHTSFYQPLLYLIKLANFSQLELNSFTGLKDKENLEKHLPNWSIEQLCLHDD